MDTPEAAPPAALPALARLRTAPASCVLGLAILAVFLLQARAGVFAIVVTAESLLGWGADFGPAVFGQGELWRLLTSVFVHVGVLHLLLNLWGLWELGPACEQRLGTPIFAVAFALFGIAGSLASIAAYPLTVGAGASGSLFGLMGLELAALLRRADPLSEDERRRRLRRLVTYLGVTGLYFAATDLGNNAAHAGGLAAGLGYGAWVLLPFPAPVRGKGARAGALAALGGLLLLCAGATSLRVPEAPTGSTEDAVDEASAHLRAGALEQAIASADEAIAAQVRVSDAYLVRAQAHEALRRTPEAISDYAAVAQGSYVLFARGRRCYLRSFVEPAAAVLAECEEAARLAGPDGYPAKLGLSRVLLGLQRPREALESAHRAWALYPKEAEPVLLEGWAQLALGELDLAQASFEKARGASPYGEAEALRGRVAVTSRRGDSAAALALLDRALQERPEDASLLGDRAVVHYRAGRLDAALADLDRVVALHPEWSQVHNNHAWYLLAAGRAREALARAERALALDPQNPRIRGTRCWVREALGDRAGALEDCTFALRAMPDSATDAGMVALLQGASLEKVKAQWAKAAETSPEDRPLFERTLSRVRKQRSRR